MLLGDQTGLSYEFRNAGTRAVIARSRAFFHDTPKTPKSARPTNSQLDTNLKSKEVFVDTRRFTDRTMMKHSSEEEEVSEGMERTSEDATADETAPVANISAMESPGGKSKAGIKGKYRSLTNARSQ